MSEECEELEAIEGEFVLHPEMRPALARTRVPVLGEDGFVSHYEVTERVCAVHTLQVGRGGWVCEFEDGTVDVVPHENVRFVDGEE